MRETDRFGETVAATGRQDQFHRGANTDAMTRRDKNRPHVGPGPDDCPDPFPLVGEPNEGALFYPYTTMLAYKSSLGATDRGEIKKKPYMGAETKSPRMRDSLTIEDHRFGRAF